MTSKPLVRFLDRTSPPHIVTLVLMAGLSAMNMSIFLPSLPAMTQFFDTPYAVMQLSVSLYLALTAVLQLFIGPIADRFGRRKVVLTCLSLFVVATIGCLFSTTIEVFLAFRMMQGFVAVGIVLSRVIVRDMVPQNEAASMIGYVTMGMALVPMFAPMIGGALDQLFQWQASFVFLFLFGSSVLWLCWADQGETAVRTATSFGQQVRSYPQLLTSPRFWGYCFAAAFASGAFFAFLGGAPFVASTVFGLSSFWAGLSFGVPAIGYALGNFITGRFAARLGINRMILVGALIIFLGMALSLMITVFVVESPWVFFGLCSAVGLGNGLVMPNATAGMLSVRPHLSGTASGLGGAIQIGGGAALSAFAGTFLQEDAGSVPLQTIMAMTALMALLSVLLVIRRERQLGLAS